MGRENGKLNKLGPAHKLAVALKLEGRKHADIAETLNTTVGTVRKWFSDPLVKEELNRRAENILDRVEEKIGIGGPAAVQSLIDMATAPGADRPIEPHHRLEAVDRLLKLHPRTSAALTPTNDSPALPEGAGGTHIGGDLNVILGELSPAEKAEFLIAAGKELAKQPAALEGSARAKP